MANGPLEWIIPPRSVAGEGLVLFAACDNKYEPDLTALLRSVDLFSPGLTVIAHVVNPSTEFLSRIKAVISQTTSTNISLSCENSDLSAFSTEGVLAYYACARFIHLAEMLRIFKRPILTIDADSIVVAPLQSEVERFLASVDLAIMRRDDQANLPAAMRVAAGAVWLKPTLGGLAVADYVRDRIRATIAADELAWFVDQVVWFDAIQDFQRSISIADLSRRFLDWNFGNGSVIWSGKGDRKWYDFRFSVIRDLLSGQSERESRARHEFAHVQYKYKLRSQVLTGRVHHILKSLPRRAAIYLPRLDLPWKRPADRHSISAQREDALALRMRWKAFCVLLAGAFERMGIKVEMLEVPGWEITPDAVDSLGVDVVVVPHKWRGDFSCTHPHVYFYMQMYLPWLFTLDRQGWGAGASVYPVDVTLLPEKNDVLLADYSQRIAEDRLKSKFRQPKRLPRQQLVDAGFIPEHPYIFVPLQIPHDENIRFFADVTEHSWIEAILTWARQENVAVVMKPHPANPKSLRDIVSLGQDKGAYIANLSIEDLIEHCQAVYTLNSGVGFEAMLRRKPVVTFGRAEYDCVALKGNVLDLPGTYHRLLAWDPVTRDLGYDRFLSWYLDRYALDLSRVAHAQSRAEMVVGQILSELDTPSRDVRQGSP